MSAGDLRTLIRKLADKGVVNQKEFMAIRERIDKKYGTNVLTKEKYRWEYNVQITH